MRKNKNCNGNDRFSSWTDVFFFLIDIIVLILRTDSFVLIWRDVRACLHDESSSGEASVRPVDRNITNRATKLR